MKRILATALALTLLFAGCTAPTQPTLDENGAVEILLSDDGVTVDGQDATPDGRLSFVPAVYTEHDIVYYPTGRDFTFGEAAEGEMHTPEEAAAHTVVHITSPGTYHIRGKLSRGQIAVDLGEYAEDNPDAVVDLILDGVDLTCTVAPAIIFYNVYECSSDDEEDASAVVDTKSAGANIFLAKDSVNTVNGSYVARIYESVDLSEDGKSVVNYDTLHKYDGAVYSCMSMNVFGDGTLNINAENEGLCSELHLTVHSGNININSANDGINTNEDGVSVTTINGGTVNITVNGKSGEGDGIDSNGWLVINGGTVIASACGESADAGIDSDLGIQLNGGTVIASGNLLDRIGESKANYTVLNFMESQAGGVTYTLKDENGSTVLSATPQNAFKSLVLSSPDLKAGSYTLWRGDTQLKVAAVMRGEKPDGFDPKRGEKPEKMPTPPDDVDPEKMPTPPDWKNPENLPERGKKPDGMTPPEGARPSFDSQFTPNLELSDTLTLQNGENQFIVG